MSTLQSLIDATPAGQVLSLPQGAVYREQVRLRGPIHIRGNGALIDCASVKEAQGIRADGISDFTLEGLRVSRAADHGIFIVHCQRALIRNCSITGSGQGSEGNGILTAYSSHIRVENCESSGNAGHGIYFSRSGDHLAVIGCWLHHNNDGGVQCNADQPGDPTSGNPLDDGLSRFVEIRGNHIHDCGRLSAAGINLMGVRDSVVRDNLLENNLAGGISLWDNDLGSAGACMDVQVLANTVWFAPGKGRFALKIARACVRNVAASNLLVCDRGSIIAEAPSLLQGNAVSPFVPGEAHVAIPADIARQGREACERGFPRHGRTR